MSQLTKKHNVISWIAQLVVAVIFLQTLFFKFTSAPESDKFMSHRSPRT